ncbi:MAG: hypothetical protein LBB26_01320 [Puniceicoccales bacterium]|jgi:hypothetical protein|nr:hypothetical protein [Puniceicoccales bacterium]
MCDKETFAGRSLRATSFSPIIITENTLQNPRRLQILIKRISQRVLRRSRRSSFFLPQPGHERLVKWIEAREEEKISPQADFFCPPTVFLGILAALAQKDGGFVRCQRQLIRLISLREKLFPAEHSEEYRILPKDWEKFLRPLQAMDIGERDVAETGLTLRSTGFETLCRTADALGQFCHMMRDFMASGMLILALGEEVLVESAVWGAGKIEEIGRLPADKMALAERELAHDPDSLFRLAIYALFLFKKQEIYPPPLAKILTSFALWCLPSTQDNLEQRAMAAMENYAKFEPLFATKSAASMPVKNSLHDKMGD